MKKPIIITVTAIVIAIYLMSSNKAYATPTEKGLTRKCDAKGCGYYGAPRGSRKHVGIDFVTDVGEKVFAPVSGKVTRHLYAASDLVHKGIEIVTGNEKHQIFYIKPTVSPGSYVKKGQVIGTADDLSKKYGSAMTNHVHHEIEINNKFIDPTYLYDKKLV